jgi:hypothetical protein
MYASEWHEVEQPVSDKDATINAERKVYERQSRSSRMNTFQESCEKSFDNVI